MLPIRALVPCRLSIPAHPSDRLEIKTPQPPEIGKTPQQRHFGPAWDRIVRGAVYLTQGLAINDPEMIQNSTFRIVSEPQLFRNVSLTRLVCPSTWFRLPLGASRLPTDRAPAAGPAAKAARAEVGRQLSVPRCFLFSYW